MNKRAVIIALNVLESSWHVATRSKNSSSFAAFLAAKVELRSAAIPEVNTFASIDYSAFKLCIYHICSSVKLSLITPCSPVNWERSE
jgi:hypothetical protein